jgi:hypothetical protein
MSRHLRAAAAAIVCAATLAVAASATGVASASTRSHSALVVRHSATAHPASTAGFLLHAGLAFYVFDHYIYKPFKAGDLTHGFTHKLKLVEAVAAALFVYHEMKLAISDVKGSKLAFLAAPITAVAAKLASLKAALGGGDTNAISAVNGSLATIGQQAAGKGYAVKQIVHSVA